MPERSDYTTGETTPIGARVDSGIYAAFREWVEEQAGKQYSEVGSALERAMLEYMEEDQIDTQLGELSDQTAKNEALIRKVLSRLNGDDLEKEKEKAISSDPPAGKSPGDRRERELHVIRAVLASDGGENKTWTASTLGEAVREVAGVSSQRSVDSYVEAITDTRAFIATGAAQQWRLDHAAARSLLAENDIPTDDEVVVDAE
jgi:hypothetical protein